MYVPPQGGYYKPNDSKSWRFCGCGVRGWHIGAGIVHLVSFIAILIALIVVGEDDTLRGHLTSDTLIFNATATAVETRELEGSDYPLGLVLVWMPLLTALSHGVQYVMMRYNSEYLENLEGGVNWIRWLEYSITAAFMTWIVAQLCGITNIFLLWLVAIVGNVALQWHGYFHERFVQMKRRHHEKDVDNKTSGSKSNGSPLAFTQGDWMPFINGSVIFIGQWSILWCYFIRTINANGAEDVPWIVWTSFFTIFALFLPFPVLQVLYTNQVEWFKDWRAYEVSFIFLSLLSKLALDWLLFIALLTERN